MELKNKVVLVTGSSSGIGKAIALSFAKAGSKVVIHYHENEQGALETQEEIQKIGVEAIVLKADLAKESDIQMLFSQIVDRFNTIDVLINNAAFPAERTPYIESNQQDLLDLFNINVVNAMLCSKYAIEIMKKQGYGKILNTSSIKGWEHGGGSVTYAVTKAAINSFTRTLAKQVAPEIQVNAVAPGYVKTRIYDNQSEDKINKWLDGTYLKRWVTVEEIAKTFIFLAENDAMTGQIIYVDGGFTLK
jgi:3-oxoacyl-[acyl-carrier protein] reductase